MPRITELSMVSVPRQLFQAAAKQMNLSQYIGSDGQELFEHAPVAANVFTCQLNPSLTQQQWADYEEMRKKTPCKNGYELCMYIFKNYQVLNSERRTLNAKAHLPKNGQLSIPFLKTAQSRLAWLPTTGLISIFALWPTNCVEQDPNCWLIGQFQKKSDLISKF